jgi:hypothetical protein
VVDLEQYIINLENVLSGYFSVGRNSPVAGRSFLLSARHTFTMGRTLITSKDVIDKYDVQKVILVDDADSLMQMQESARWVKEHIHEIAQPHSEHYLTLINLVVPFKTHISNEVRKFIEGYAQIKYFRFFLHGWAQVGITGVCLSDGEVVCGKRVSEMKRLFVPPVSSYGVTGGSGSGTNR